jgi:lipopolysaccharide/colanic/teichoic acid biosynthesis glycosyltransferase
LPAVQDAQATDDARYGEWHCRRLVVRPGINGPTLVGRRGGLSFKEWARLEIEYVEH